jgi:hypothetical protein
MYLGLDDLLDNGNSHPPDVTTNPYWAPFFLGVVGQTLRQEVSPCQAEMPLSSPKAAGFTGKWYSPGQFDVFSVKYIKSIYILYPLTLCVVPLIDN